MSDSKQPMINETPRGKPRRIPPRRCKYWRCNKDYVPTSNRQKYCTPACRDEYFRTEKEAYDRHYERERERSAQDKRSKLVCKRCGTTFKGRRSNSPLCGPCAVVKPTVFVGVDGEGIEGRCQECDCELFRSGDPTTPKVCVCGHRQSGKDGTTGHVHTYVLLGCGADHIKDPAGLDHRTIFWFLYTQYEKTPWAAFVGYYLNYDFTHWLKTIPEVKAWLLLSKLGQRKRIRRDGEGVAHGRWPVRLYEPDTTTEGWEIDMLGDKRLQLRPIICDCDIQRGTKCAHKRPGWMYICDAGPFFQMSFLSAINPEKWPLIEPEDEPLCTEEEYALIKEGKSHRGGADLDDDMIAYNALEISILKRLMTRIESGLREEPLDVRLKKSDWYGPGAAAAVWLKKVGAPRRDKLEEGVVPYDVDQAALAAYYGGWFEVMMHGHIPGITWEYDIGSAYPAVTRELPCLFHGEWRKDKRRFDAKLGPGEIRLVHAPPGGVAGSDPHIGAMLHRNPDMSILRPLLTGGWFWADELVAAHRAGLIDTVTVDDGWTYRPCDCPSPFATVDDLYSLRLAVNKDSSAGKAIKLLLNSLYGKFAQTVGNRTYATYVYAGRITSLTRTAILNAIATHPEGTAACVMVATDAVYFTAPHPGLPLSTQLGDWEQKEKVNLTVYKPGCYWDDEAREAIRDGEKPIFKARGINAKAFARKLREVDQKFSVLAEHGDADNLVWPAVQYTPDFAMIPARSAVHRGKWYLAGLVCEILIDQSSDPIKKRTGPYFDGTILRSRPWPQAEELTSKPYPDPATLETLAEMADVEIPERFVEDAVSMDGPVDAILYGMIGTGQYAD